MALHLMNGQRQLGTSKAIRSRNDQARPFKTRPGKHVLACSTRPFQVGPWFQHRLINSKIVSNLSRPSRVETGELGFLQQRARDFYTSSPPRLKILVPAIGWCRVRSQKFGATTGNASYGASKSNVVAISEILENGCGLGQSGFHRNSFSSKNRVSQSTGKFGTLVRLVGKFAGCGCSDWLAAHPATAVSLRAAAPTPSGQSLRLGIGKQTAGRGVTFFRHCREKRGQPGVPRRN